MCRIILGIALAGAYVTLGHWLLFVASMAMTFRDGLGPDAARGSTGKEALRRFADTFVAMVRSDLVVGCLATGIVLGHLLWFALPRGEADIWEPER